MSDPIELLRAHDPERAGTAAPPIEPLLERLDEQPSLGRRGGTAGGPPRRTRQARTASGLVALGLAAALVVAFVLVVSGGEGDGGGTLGAANGSDTAASAIVHVRRRSVIEQPNGRAVRAVMQDGRGRAVGTMDGPVERWSSDGPRRWREVQQFAPDARRKLPGATVEQAYADGILLRRESYRRGISRQRLDPGARPRRSWTAASELMEGTVDPRAAVEEMVDRGVARAAGESTRDGRRLLRFVAERRGRDLGRRGSISGGRTTYLLDPDSYAPIEIFMEPLPPPGRSPRSYGGLSTRFVYEVYELLPPTPVNQRLLEFGGPIP